MRRFGIRGAVGVALLRRARSESCRSSECVLMRVIDTLGEWRARRWRCGCLGFVSSRFFEKLDTEAWAGVAEGEGPGASPRMVMLGATSIEWGVREKSVSREEDLERWQGRRREE